MTQGYWEKLEYRDRTYHSLCIGLDPDVLKLPRTLDGQETFWDDPPKKILDFNRRLVEATSQYACAYKPNLAFYLKHGPAGLETLIETVKYIRAQRDSIPVILDGKFGDIDNTNEAYAQFAFTVVGADAVTIHNYLGSQAMQPFLDRSDKGIYILCRTSNPGAGELQNLLLEPTDSSTLQGRLYLGVAETVRTVWNKNHNCGLVTGATYPEDIQAIRRANPDLPFLIPGVGKQGGDLRAAIRAAAGTNGAGRYIINVGSDIYHASAGPDSIEAAATKAKYYHEEIMRHSGELAGELASYRD